MSEEVKVSPILGTDPEFFVKNEKGEFVSAERFLKGTKHEPEILKESGSASQFDNVAAEFATTPSANVDEMISKIRTTFVEMLNKLPKGHSFSFEPSVEFPESELQTEASRLFGCDPDACAWECTTNEAPDAEETNFRSIGGHIHVGHEEGDGYEFLLDWEEDTGKPAVVRTMDAFHGVISVMFDHSQAAVDRRKLYGRAGCHRTKEYGIEYRVLSSFWLKSPKLVKLMGLLTIDVLNVVKHKLHTDIINAVGKDTIINTINNCDVATAQSIIENDLKEYMSGNTVELLEECLATYGEMDDFKTEWAVGA